MPWLRALRAKLSTLGSSSRHGPHQLAQRWMRKGRPRRSFISPRMRARSQCSTLTGGVEVGVDVGVGAGVGADPDADRTGAVGVIEPAAAACARARPGSSGPQAGRTSPEAAKAPTTEAKTDAKSEAKTARLRCDARLLRHGLLPSPAVCPPTGCPPSVPSRVIPPPVRSWCLGRRGHGSAARSGELTPELGRNVIAARDENLEGHSSRNVEQHAGPRRHEV